MPNPEPATKTTKGRKRRAADQTAGPPVAQQGKEATVEATAVATADDTQDGAAATTTADTAAEPDADAEATATAADATPAEPDPFDYDASILTVSISFLPLTAGGIERQAVISVHSKNGTAPAVLPQFIAPLRESELHLPAAVLKLLETYRTVTLPQRRAAAATKAAEKAAKRPVSRNKTQEVRPGHIQTASRTPARKSAGVATQFKLNLKKGTP